jgi:hypothetical protein
MPMYSEWPLPFRYSYQNFMRISHLGSACYILRPSHPIPFRLDHPTYFVRRTSYEAHYYAVRNLVPCKWNRRLSNRIFGTTGAKLKHMPKYGVFIKEEKKPEILLS